MDKNAKAAIERFIGHVERQRASGKATDALKEERATIMDELVAALGLPLKEIHEKLGVYRTTWERWRTMENIPSRSYLDALGQIMEDQGKAVGPPLSVESRTAPLEFVSASPRTYSQLRLLFFHRAYTWREAVFHFKKPFEDVNAIVDVASMALNGCRIVYMLTGSQLKDHNSPWHHKFVVGLVESLGVALANQALAGISILQIGETVNLPEFGILNYDSGKEDEKVGYVWQGNQKSDSKDSATVKDAYYAIPARDNCFAILKLRFREGLRAAFNKIDESRARGVWEPQDLYSPEQQKFGLTIPKINSENVNEIEHLKVYVS